MVDGAPTSGQGPLAGCPRWASVGFFAGSRQPPSSRAARSERQTWSGIARRRARAAAKLIAQGQRAGRWSVRRRAERVSRPARLNSRRRSVFVVTIPSVSPMRAVQRARLLGQHLHPQPGPVNGEAPLRQVIEPHPRISDRGWRS